MYVQTQLTVVEQLNKQVELLDSEVRRITRSDATCRRLMTVPGVGPVVALRFTAALDDVRRFESAHKMQSYLGLTPGERSSSDRIRRTGITKAGCTALRCALVQAAWSARRTRRNDPMLAWAKEVEKRRGKMVAATALARKLAGILYALWRNETVYDPKRSASTMAAP
jgi:transposase